MTEIQEIVRKKRTFSLLASRSRAQAALADPTRNSWWVLGAVTILALIQLMFYLYLALQGAEWQRYGLVGAAVLLLLGGVLGILMARGGQIKRGVWVMLVLGMVSFVISPLFVADLGIWYAGIILIAMLIISTLCFPSGQSNWANLLAVLAGIGALAVDNFMGGFQVAPAQLLTYVVYSVFGLMVVGYLITLFIFFTTFDLQAKITVTMFTVTVISIVAISVINNITTRRELVSAVNQTLLVAADYTARSVDEYFLELAQQVSADALSRYLLVHLELPEEARLLSPDAGIYMRSQRTRNNVEQYVLLDRNGVVLVHTQYSDWEDVAELPPYLGFGDVDRNTFLISILSDLPFYSSVIFPEDGEPYFYVGARILNWDEQPVGMLLAMHPLSGLQAVVEESKELAGEGSYGVLLNQDYLRIAHGSTSEGLYQLVAPLSDAEMQTKLANRNLPNRPVEELYTNFPEFAAGLAGIAETPFFAAREAGTGDEINSVAVVRLETQRRWFMAFVQPQSIILRPVETQTRTIILFASVIAGLTVLIATALAQLLSRPIVQLTRVAEKAAAGDWSLKAPTQSKDEIGTLAGAFNTMTDQLQQTFEELETRVEERTAALAHTSEQMEYRARRLQTVAEVAHVIAAEQDPEKLLPLVTETISRQFDYYHVGVFLLDKDDEYAVLQAANSEGGQRMLARGHRLKVGEVGIVGYATKRGLARIALDVGDDAVYFDNPDLPQTRSEIALPLKIGVRVIGALDVQSTESGAFNEDDIALLSTLADQVAMAIQNARLFGETQRTLRELQTAQRQYIREEWVSLAAEKSQTGYQYLFGNLLPVSSDAAETIVSGDQELQVTEPGKGSAEEPLSIPIALRGQVIGLIQMGGPEDLHAWSEEEVLLAQAVADQVGLALENARLLEVTQRRAERERAVAEITTRLRATNDPQAILDAAVSELRTALRAKTVRVSIQKKDGS